MSTALEVARRPHVPPWEVPGHVWAVVEDNGWTLPAPEGMRCRHSPRLRCPNPPVAGLYRGHGAYLRPWWYCAEHMYGRWIESGLVVMWRLVKA